MVKEQFDNMMAQAINLYNKCETVVAQCGKKSDFENLTIKQAKHCVDLARVLQSQQDKLLKNELYHVIGMSDLNAVQMSMFLKVIKNISNTRGMIKLISSYAVPTAGEKNKESIYDCKVLNIKLKSTMED